MASSTCTCKLISVALLLLLLRTSPAWAVGECDAESFGACYNKSEAMSLKIIAIFSILVASMVGVCLPLFSRSVPALQPDGNLFVVVKAFASGVILATGYMHVLPDSFDDLRSPCLPQNPWHVFPFSTFAAMMAAVFTLLLDSLMVTFHSRRNGVPSSSTAVIDHGSLVSEMVPVKDVEDGGKLAIQRNRVIAQVLEMGIIVHSVVIGLSMGASQNPCTIRPLVAALCFHQLFEGMGLGGCILQAEYKIKMKSILAFFFATTTPFGIVLGIGLSNVYSQSSPTALIVVGLLNGVSAGLLNYMALVDLLASDFMGRKLQSSVKLQFWAFLAMLLGAGGMSLMAKWA